MASDTWLQGATEETYRALLESAPDAMVVVDGGGRIVLVNAQTEALFGYPREQLLGQPIEILIPQRFSSAHERHRSGYTHDPRVRPMGASLELFGLRRDGTEFPVEVSLSPIPTSGGTLVASAIRDSTPRKRFERELREKNFQLENANLTKDRFLASMSHELRTPLNAIIGFTGTLLMKLPGPLTSEQEQQLRTVQTSARHLLSLINDILDLAKIESGKVELHFETILVRDVIGDVVRALRPIAEQKGIELVVHVPETPVPVHADRRALHQIFLNLTSNAIKFTDRGSVVFTLTSGVAQGRSVISVSVADTGLGIKDEDRARLFQAFAQIDGSNTRAHEGAGLGLYLSQRLASLLGGSIDVSSEYGKGSTFTFVMPRH